jgi:hypothetical protein
MAERFRIDLGFPNLYASLSLAPSGGADGVVVYNSTTQQLFYSGSFSGGGGGSTIDTGSFIVNALATDNNITFTRGNGTSFFITVDTGSNDNYGKLVSNDIVNSGSLDVIISSSLTVDQYNNNDIFLIKKSGVTKVKVNNQGVLTLMPTSSFPTAVTGGIIYKDNEYYFGFQ